MAKRVFLCTDTDYPQLDAASNYVANLSKAFRVAGYEPYIISLDRSGQDANDWQQNSEGINFNRVKYTVNNKCSVVMSRMRGAHRMICALQEQGVSENDVLVIYLYKWYLALPIVNWAKKKGITIWASVVEWFEKDSYNQDKCFRAYSRCNGVLAISKNIKEHFEELGLKTIIVPPLVDMRTFNAPIEKQKDDGRVRFLYTGSFVGKDDMKVMLEALALLLEKKRNLIEYHITRYDDEALIKASGIDKKIWNTISHSVVTHGDVTHEQLEMLLMESDFLTIARQKNRTTISNFPSKVAESMAYGIIPIMTKVGDCPNDYLVDGFDSILFDECTPEDCAQAFERAIVYVQSNKINEMRMNAYESAEKLFGIDVFSDKLAGF